MSNSEQISSITEDQLISNGFHKSVRENGMILFSRRIPRTNSDFIVMKAESGLFYAPQVQSPGKSDVMLADDNQENLYSMDEINSYYRKALGYFTK